MMLGRKSPLVGIDIGSRAIKIAEAGESKKQYQLKAFAIADLASGLIDNGAIIDRDAIAAIISDLFKQNKIKNRNVALSIGGYSVIVKRITIETMSDADFLANIHAEAEQYIPFDISEVNLDYQIVGENQNNPEQMDVLLVAAKKEMIAEYIDILRAAKLNPCVIDVEAFALQNLFEFNFEPTEDCVVLIDIGASKTSINVLDGPDSLFMRDISIGCFHLDEMIADQLECTMEQAESRRLKNGHDAKLKPIIDAAASDWCGEINQVINHFYSSHRNHQISRAILTGGGAFVEPFNHQLALDLSIDTVTMDPFVNLAIHPKCIAADRVRQLAPQLAIAMGLTLRKIDDK